MPGGLLFAKRLLTNGCNWPKAAIANYIRESKLVGQLFLKIAARPAWRQRNVTGLWGGMRVEARYRSPQKMSDHRVAHIFRAARAFAPKPQHIALSPGWAHHFAQSVKFHVA